MDYNARRFFYNYEKGYYLVFDTETTLIEKDKSVYACPPEFVAGVVYTEEDRALDASNSRIFTDFYEKNSMANFLKADLSFPCILVGHNVCFDLLVTGITNLPELGNDFVWDTAIGEYEMMGQAITYPSLQQLANKYCPGEFKESSVSEMIKAGVCPSSIPKRNLLDYCRQDVYLTRQIFVAQMKEFVNYPTNLQNLILQRMKYRMITHEMSCNGMWIDASKMAAVSRELEEEESLLEKSLRETMSLHMPGADEVNPASNSQLAGVLYGEGAYKCVVSTPTGEFFKTGPNKGKVKLKKETLTKPYIRPLAGVLKSFSSVGEESLKKILGSPSSNPECVDFVEKLLKYRTISKERRTYFNGYLAVSVPVYGIHNSIHTEFKHTATPTGRISSSKPNIQNLKSD